MAVTSKSTLKGYFNTGDKPTEAQFNDLIDSFLHYNENGGNSINLTSITASNGFLFGNITASGDITGSGRLSMNNITASNLQVGTGSFDKIHGDLIVSGNILPVTDSGSFTSSFSLGSETAAWKDLFVSEDSIKFVRRKNDNTTEILASIQIDKDSGDEAAAGTADVLKLKDPTGDHMDFEARLVQVGKDRQRGFLFNDGKGHFSTNVFGKFQSYQGGGKGQQLLMRPESEGSLGFLGRKSKSHFFNAQGAGSMTVGLQNFDGDRNGFFKIDTGTSIAGFGTSLFEVHESKQTTFFGTDSVVTVEGIIESTGGSFTGGNTIIEEAVVTQPGTISQSINIGNLSGTSPSTLEMVGVGSDNSIRISSNEIKQVTTITFPFNGLRTASLEDSTLGGTGAFYFATREGTFHTFTFTGSLAPSSGISGSLTEALLSSNFTSGSSGISTGPQLASTIANKIHSKTGFTTTVDVNKVVVTLDNPGEAIEASTTFPTTTASLATTVKGRGTEIRVNEGSVFRIISQQPDVTVNPADDVVTLSNGGGDETTFTTGQFGTNPQYIPVHMVIPGNNIAIWYGPIYIGRGYQQFSPVGNFLNLDEVGQGQNASLRLYEGAQIKVQAF